MPAVKVLLVSPDPDARQAMGLAVRGIRRALGADTIDLLDARDGEEGVAVADAQAPEVIVADEIASRAGAFALAHDLRNREIPFPGTIVILLDRPQDAWLARWSGADAWFDKPVDPFALADRILELTRAKETA
jgi:DNA-binding response OmpR family regulator